MELELNNGFTMKFVSIVNSVLIFSALFSSIIVFSAELLNGMIIFVVPLAGSLLGTVYAILRAIRIVRNHITQRGGVIDMIKNQLRIFPHFEKKFSKEEDEKLFDNLSLPSAR